MSELHKLAQDYIDRYNLDSTVEELFEEFECISKSIVDFENYLKESKIIYEINKMKRDKRLKQKRALFCKWYFSKFENSNKKNFKTLMIELSEMVFLSERTVQSDVFAETTAKPH